MLVFMNLFLWFMGLMEGVDYVEVFMLVWLMKMFKNVLKFVCVS